jgi:CheY-like chemotaxis protein
MVPDPGRADPALTSLRELVRHVGHDLNNHLASVIVHLSLASSPGMPEHERQLQIREAQDAARQAALLARELFAVGNGQNAGTAPAEATTSTATVTAATAAATSTAAAPATAAAAKPPSLLDPRVDATSDAPLRGQAARPGSTARSVLVLEDDDSVATMMRDVLGHFGYDVAVTQSPETCITLYDDARQSGHPFDLVVLDLTIRGGQRRGVDTLAALRIIDPGVRAVAHSGDPETDIMRDPRRHGFVGAIRKPTPLAQLSRLVQTLIEKEG